MKLTRQQERQRMREENVDKAAEAAHRRGIRNVGTLRERVESAAQRLKGAPAGDTLAILDTLSTAEREVYLLAEEHLGRNRQEILRRFPAPRQRTQEAFAQAVAEEVELPEQSDVPANQDIDTVSEEPDNANESGDSNLVVYDSPEELMSELERATEEMQNGN